MKGHKTATLLPPILAALAIIALTLYAYRSLPARLFAADDYQWLLSVQGLSFGALVRRAFDPAAQTHFYRPLIWLLFWLQTRAFGLDPRGFHAVSLALHLLNAALLGALAQRLTPKLRIEHVELRMPDRFYMFNSQFSIPLLAIAIVALHPAPFEAVVWISAQSELLAAALLLLALHLWLCRRPTLRRRSGQANDERRTTKEEESGATAWRLVIGRWSVLATLALSLALLAKESAIIGLPLLMLLGRAPRTENPEPQNRRTAEPQNYEQRTTNDGQFAIRNFMPYLLPTLVTLAYVALQVTIERHNYLLEQGGYGLGMQIALNPLRSLALLVAPLPGTEQADTAWLVPLGALVATLLAGFTIGARQDRSSVVVMLALGLTLLPTAPFASPPDSRYLYLPVMAGALLVGVMRNQLRVTSYQQRAWLLVTRHSSLVTGLFVVALAWWAASELHTREGHFAAASGPGGSLWRVATWACDASRPERVVIVAPPVAAPHVEAIVGLACGPDVRAKIVGRDQVANAITTRTLVIAFANGSAEVQQWP